MSYTSTLNVTKDRHLESKSQIGDKKTHKYILFLGKKENDIYESNLSSYGYTILNGGQESFEKPLSENKTLRANVAAIVIELHNCSFPDLKKLISYFKNLLNLQLLPLIVISNTLSEEEKLILNEQFCVDDVVNEGISANDLHEKIKLLNKYKALKDEHLPLELKRGKNKSSIDIIDAVIKRIMDILIAAFSLMVLSPFLLLIAFIIRLESKGPVFYTSLRAGRGYRIFPFFKFRTMYVDADKRMEELIQSNQYNRGGVNSPFFFKMKNDPRITRFGSFLRNTSLDELPQFINVIKGDMSLVGNRPLPLYEACILTTDRHVERFLAPAGITGLWQVNKRGQKQVSAEERIDLDIAYAQNYSFKKDLLIMLNTPKALFQKENV